MKLKLVYLIWVLSLSSSICFAVSSSINELVIDGMDLACTHVSGPTYNLEVKESYDIDSLLLQHRFERVGNKDDCNTLKTLKAKIYHLTPEVKTQYYNNSYCEESYGGSYSGCKRFGCYEVYQENVRISFASKLTFWSSAVKQKRLYGGQCH